jgi:hypothetical protein
LIGVDQESDQERRFFFAHVQKAAGTSLFVRMQRHFSRAQIYPDASDLGGEAQEGDRARPALPRLAATLLVSHLLERYPIRRSEIRVVAGHFPLRTTELLGDQFTTLTLVREPVARTLSALRHQQVKAPADRDRPLEELYDDPIRFHGLIHNHMVKVFSLSPEEIAAGDGVMARVEDFTTARLHEAKARLADVDVLGLHDDLDGFCTVLTDRFGWQLGAGVHANRTEPIDVSRSFRERIARDNAADAELYDYARELYARRGAVSTARGA